MIRSEENSGIIWFLLGLIVLVMAGVLLSILVDSRFSFSRGKAEHQRFLAENDADLADLRSIARARQEALTRAITVAGDSASQLQELTPQNARREQEMSALARKRTALRESITALEKSFADYRSAYRDAEWRHAIGEKHPSLTVRGGRIYREVEITRVTPVGLEIRHADGIARIGGPDLPLSFQERFQWQDEERRAALDAEDENHRLTTETPDPPTRSTPPATPPATPSAIAEELTTARTLVIQWETRVTTLASEYNTAVSMSGRSRNTSVPGSLETWQARAQRLGSELQKARRELATVKIRLAALSPDDPLLRPQYEP